LGDLVSSCLQETAAGEDAAEIRWEQKGVKGEPRTTQSANALADGSAGEDGTTRFAPGLCHPQPFRRA
jgi:hypothetical protein